MRPSLSASPALTGVQLPRGPRPGADRDLRAVIAHRTARWSSLLAAERRLLVLGHRLVILVVNEH